MVTTVIVKHIYAQTGQSGCQTIL